jgi:hypothetical protein
MTRVGWLVSTGFASAGMAAWPLAFPAGGSGGFGAGEGEEAVGLGVASVDAVGPAGEEGGAAPAAGCADEQPARSSTAKTGRAIRKRDRTGRL